MISLAAGLKVNTGLRTLSVAGTETPELRGLFEALKVNSTLTDIDISRARRLKAEAYHFLSFSLGNTATLSVAMQITQVLCVNTGLRALAWRGIPFVVCSDILDHLAIYRLRSFDMKSTPQIQALWNWQKALILLNFL